MKRFVEDNVQKQLGVDFRKEVIDNLTGRYARAVWMQPPIQLNSQVSINALELKNVDQAKVTIATIREHFVGKIETETIVGHVVNVIGQDVSREFPEGLRRPQPCFTVTGNWLLTSDSKEFLERALLTSQGSLGSLKTVPEFELIMSELGGKLDGEKPFLVSFQRSSEYLRQVFELVKSKDTRRFLRKQGESNAMVKKLADLVERNDLPEYEELEKYFAPSGTFAYDEPTGLHLGSFTLRGDTE